MFKNFEAVLNSPTLSDVQFTFSEDDEILFGHKIILSVHSNVFNQMFNGPLAGRKDIIQVQECNREEFSEVLRYCYTGVPQLSKLNVKGIMLAANYYMIEDLEGLCCNFLSDILNVENLCEIYEDFNTFRNKLTEKCLRLFDDNMQIVTQQSNFLNMSASSISCLLQRNTLSVEEFDLFKAIDKWLQANSDQADQSIELYKHIRFPIMSLEEFVDCCNIESASKIFSSKNMKDALNYIRNGRVNESLIFSTLPREIYNRTVVKFPKTFTYDGKDRRDPFELMAFTVSRKLKVKSFKFRSHDSCTNKGQIEYGLDLSVYDGQVFFTCQSKKPYIKCNEMITLIPNVQYVLKSWEKDPDYAHDYCDFVYSEFPKYEDTDEETNESVLALPVGPFVLKHIPDEDPDIPDNKTYLASISIKILK